MVTKRSKSIRLRNKTLESLDKFKKKNKLRSYDHAVDLVLKRILYKNKKVIERSTREIEF